MSGRDFQLQWLTSPDDVPHELRRGLTECWRDVANAGGAVGFAEEVPVTADVVAAVVDEIVGALHLRLRRLR